MNTYQYTHKDSNKPVLAWQLTPDNLKKGVPSFIKNGNYIKIQQLVYKYVTAVVGVSVKTNTIIAVQSDYIVLSNNTFFVLHKDNFNNRYIKTT